jgi:phage baseplate assembly protein V
MMDNLRRALDPIARKMRMMAGRAVLKLMKNVVSIQVEALQGEVRDAAELFQQYGFRSKPLPGAEGILLSLGGNRDHTVIICMDDRRYQLDLLEAGEAAMYTDEGDSFVLKRGRIAELTTDRFVINAPGGTEFNTPLLKVNGGDVKADDISLKDHLTTGVKAGGDTSGVPTA